MRKLSAFDKLPKDEKDKTIQRILTRQGNLSYISGKTIDLAINKIEVDHIIALDKNGPDNESNWGVVIDSENSSKGARDLQLMRYIYAFRKHTEKFLNQKRDFNLGDALTEFFSTRNRIKVKFNEDRTMITINYIENRESRQLSFPIIEDSIDKSIKSFVGMIPFSIIFHDQTVNPRSIVDLEPLIEEFYHKNPQLFPSLAMLETDVDGNGTINVFDGQHKAAAQLYNRSQNLFLRVFINADKTKIKRTNLRAHTIVAQIHFPQLVSDKVGHDLFKIEFEPFIDKVDIEKGSEFSFIKQEDMNEEYRKYLCNYYRYNAIINQDGERNKILDFVETISARSKKYPISYDTLSKTFLNLIYSKPAQIKLKESVHFRKLEFTNLWKIMEIFTEEVLESKFDTERGIFKLEERLLDDPDSIPDNHLIAYRLCRRSAMVIWMGQFSKALALMLKTHRKYKDNNWANEKKLWVEMNENDLNHIRKMFMVIKDHNIWKTKTNKEVLSALGSTKQVDWDEMLINGKLPGREGKLFEPLTDTFIFQSSTDLL